MNSIRLLPIVVMATFALLLLKGFGLITEGGYILSGTNVAQAQQADPAQGELSDAELKAASRATETLFSGAGQSSQGGSQLDAVPMVQNKSGDKIAIGSTDGISNTEKAVLERLSERRTELDLLSSELDMRIALVDAAEQRLNERVAGLKEIEARISSLVEEKKALDDAQFKGLVSMYETMKPGDAAKIFDTLPINVLLRVARSMSPRKMAPVLAKMTTKRATELTQRLAAAEAEPSLNAPIGDPANLPQIVGE